MNLRNRIKEADAHIREQNKDLQEKYNTLKEQNKNLQEMVNNLMNRWTDREGERAGEVVP